MNTCTKSAVAFALSSFNSLVRQAFTVLACSLLLGHSAFAQTSGSVSITATLGDISSVAGTEHWIVVWVTKADGTFVRTIRRQGNQGYYNSHWGNHCDAWYAAVANIAARYVPAADGYTGSTAYTYSAPNSPFTQSWNCRDDAGATVPDGTYKIWIQYAEDTAVQGPVTTNGVTWIKGPSAATVNPPNQGANFNNMSIVWLPTTANNDSTLSGLALSDGILSPSFASNTFSYAASVPNATSAVTVTPTAMDSSSTIRVNGTISPSGSASQTIPLVVGPNTITIQVTDQDGVTTSTYTTTVTRAPSSVSTLSGLTLSSGTISPSFSPATDSYAASVPNATGSVTVTPTASESTATIRVNGTISPSGSASQTIPLVVGPNTITIEVTAQDGVTTSTYTTTVTRAPSSVSTLSGLTLSSGMLSPAFDSSVVGYGATVTNASSSLTVTPTATESTATVKVNGTVSPSGVASQAIPLTVGANAITIQVTAQDGVSATTYIVMINRLPSSIATLSGLSLSQGVLSPAFESSTTSYTAIVANTVAAIKVTPYASDESASVIVNGAIVPKGSASQAIPLVVGGNSLAVLIIAQDGLATKTYSINITRVVSSVSTLSGLVISPSQLSPAFKSATSSYTSKVSKSTKSVKIKATASSSVATIKVNGVSVKSGAFSRAIPLEVGKNTIKIVVTSQNNTSKTYKIVVTRGNVASTPLKLVVLPVATARNPKTLKTNVDGKSFLQLTVMKSSNAMRPVVEVSSDLVEWFSGDKHTTTLVDDDSLLRVRDNTPTTSEAKRHIRVRWIKR